MRTLAISLVLTFATLAARADEPHGEVEKNVIPVVGGDTDVGFGFGGVGSIARAAPGVVPYAWNVEASGLITFKVEDGLHAPYQDLLIRWTVPEVAPRLRLTVSPEYNREHAYYYGLGNASTTVAPAYGIALQSETQYFQFARTHPQIAAELRYEVLPHFFALGGVSYTQTWMSVRSPSKLTDDLENGSLEVKKLLADAPRDNAVALFSYGVQWDTRDSEIAPTHGFFDQARLRISPGGLPTMPYRYTNLEISGRGYWPIAGPKWVFAARWVFDLLTGHPPFYELARFEETNALGGPYGVRGVPAQRYYGKIKMFGGGELRTELGRFRALDKNLVLGAVVFVDVGRVWADYGHHPELDGAGAGLKYGFGGGVRVRSGQTFVLRADLAWSPDARPIGGYLGAGHAF
jgi:hypothetical protein